MKANSKIKYSAKKILMIMSSSLALSFLMYSFAIASTTINVSEANLLNDELQELNTEISELEHSYYTMVNKLSLEQALSEGFVKDSGVSFAYVEQTTTVAYLD